MQENDDFTMPDHNIQPPEAIGSYSKIVFTAEPIVIANSRDFLEHREWSTNEIYSDHRRRGRTLDQVFHASESLILEPALAKVLGQDFDYKARREVEKRDRHGWVVDVEDKIRTKATFDTKRVHNLDEKKFGISEESFKMMKNNVSLLSFIVTGTYKLIGDDYHTQFNMIIRAQSFIDHSIKTSSGWYEYPHDERRSPAWLPHNSITNPKFLERNPDEYKGILPTKVVGTKERVYHSVVGVYRPSGQEESGLSEPALDREAGGSLSARDTDHHGHGSPEAHQV